MAEFNLLDKYSDQCETLQRRFVFLVETDRSPQGLTELCQQQSSLLEIIALLFPPDFCPSVPEALQNPFLPVRTCSTADE